MLDIFENIFPSQRYQININRSINVILPQYIEVGLRASYFCYIPLLPLVLLSIQVVQLIKHSVTDIEIRVRIPVVSIFMGCLFVESQLSFTINTAMMTNIIFSFYLCLTTHLKIAFTTTTTTTAITTITSNTATSVLQRPVLQLLYE